MKNIQVSVKKFLGNKNTVTIIGVIICIIILYVGYKYQISRAANLVDMPVANADIQPRTQITSNLIKTVEVPSSLLEGEFYSNPKDIVGKYTNYNSMIAKGSLFYRSLLIEAENMPSAVYADVPEGHTVISYPVNMDTTYANTIEPETYINIYFKALNDENKVIFGKFINNIKVLAVKDSSGQNVFETTEEARTPAYIIFAVPEDIHELIRKAMYISDDYGIELLLVPNTLTITEEGAIQVTSADIRDYIMERTAMIDINEEVSDDELWDKEAAAAAQEEQQQENAENNEENTNNENNQQNNNQENQQNNDQTNEQNNNQNNNQ